MTPYRLNIAPRAQKQLHALAAKPKTMALKIIEALAVNPRPPGAEKITGLTGLYSLSVRTVRLVYKIEEQEVLLLLVK